MNVIRLSKSKFLSGLQCPKRLYLEVYSPELATPPDPWRQAMLDKGKLLGELARARFPGGVLVECTYRRPAEALSKTAALVADPSVPAIFEGAFEYDRVLVRVDVLQRSPSHAASQANRGAEPRKTNSGDLSTEARSASEGGWKLIEVKSSSRAKEEHLADLAIQAHVLRGAGIELDGCALMHVNTNYTYRGGEVELDQLFAVEDLTEELRGREEQVPGRVAEMKDLLASRRTPAIEPGDHCRTPYECPFWAYCTKDKSDRWVYHLPGGDRLPRDLVAQGIQTIDDIPALTGLTPVQHRVKNNVEWVSPRLRQVLQTVRYPVHHLDFETVMPAVPRFEGTRPYQAIPTQWSNHIEHENGAVRHDEYLCGELKDPREEWIRTLMQSLGAEGSICVYSGYERGILERVADTLPNLRGEINAVIDRLWDLLAVLREHYYHPGFKGSYSIKSVLPALVPDLGYTDLEIQDGGTAAHLYERMLFHETDWVERARLRDALLSYCQRDSLAMLEIRRALLGRSGDAKPGSH